MTVFSFFVPLDLEINPRSNEGRKASGATIEKASLMRAEGLKNKKNLVYNSSGLATALLKYRRFFK